ncbi:hypothetical protein BJ742DRAFT_828781 [Cladochytrium replicatum]|nr:hypothetical protein BJ742DRAFT_828781 [Cladochytrium replicatum]
MLDKKVRSSVLVSVKKEVVSQITGRAEFEEGSLLAKKMESDARSVRSSKSNRQSHLSDGSPNGSPAGSRPNSRPGSTTQRSLEGDEKGIPRSDKPAPIIIPGGEEEDRRLIFQKPVFESGSLLAQKERGGVSAKSDMSLRSDGSGPLLRPDQTRNSVPALTGLLQQHAQYGGLTQEAISAIADQVSKQVLEKLEPILNELVQTVRRTSGTASETGSGSSAPTGDRVQTSVAPRESVVGQSDPSRKSVAARGSHAVPPPQQPPSLDGGLVATIGKKQARKSTGFLVDNATNFVKKELDVPIALEDWKRRTSCPRCKGAGFRHENGGKHDRPKEVKCKSCQTCQACSGSGVVVDKSPCPKCNALGHEHKNKEREHVGDISIRCVFCTDCRECKALGVVQTASFPESSKDHSEAPTNPPSLEPQRVKLQQS